MKLLVVLLLSCVFLKQPYAQNPETVYSIVRQIKTYDWYVKQAGLWKKQIDVNPADANAWLNYYMANRMAKFTGEPEKWLNTKDSVLKDLDFILKMAEKSIPQTFEYNYMKWYNGGNNPVFFPYLQKAYDLAPGRPETYDDMVTYYEIRKMGYKRKEFNEKWFRSNVISQGIISFGYNMLMSVENNAILLTNGDNDTYPLWMLQDAKGICPDVHVLNINLLLIEDYRRLCFKELGIPKYEIDWKKSNSATNVRIDIINHIVKNKGKYPLYFAVSVQPELYEKIESNLYNEGLAMKYSDSSYDNIAILKRNVETRFLTDNLLTNLQYDISESVVTHINTNYMIAFITLYQHDKKSMDLNQAEKMKKLILVIAEKGGMEADVKKYFEE